MSAHAETALDQLRLADDAIPEPTREQLRENAHVAALVHALLAVAETARPAPIFIHPPADPPTQEEIEAFKEAARTHVARPLP